MQGRGWMIRMRISLLETVAWTEDSWATWGSIISCLRIWKPLNRCFQSTTPKKIHGKTGIFAYMESLYVFKSRCRYITVLRSRRDFSHLISTFEFHQPAPLMQGYISRDDFRRAMKASDVRMSKMATWRCKSGSHGEICCPWTQGRNHWMLDMVGRPAI